MSLASALSAAERESLIEGAARLGVELGPAAVALCAVFLDSLIFWSRSMNLVGDREREVLIRRHLVDSMAAVALIRDAALRAPAIADLGSGAGMPGVPLAIALPEARLTLFEARRKRAHFLRAVARALPGLKLKVVEQRIEDLGPSLRGSFDVVVSRAAFRSEVLLAAARPMLKPGGMVVSYRGTSALETGGSPAHTAFSPPTLHPYTLGSGRSGCLELWRLRST